MPLLTLNDLEQVSPVFCGTAGNELGQRLMQLLSIDRLNELYDRNLGFSGPDFAGAVLGDIGIEYDVINPEVLFRLPEGPFITISNHPYGSIDGILLLDLFGHIRPDYKVMANKILDRVEPLRQNFISVTPVGNVRTAPSADSLQGIKGAIAHVRAGHPMGIFPSGAVSDLSLKDRCIRDREWQEPVIKLIRKLNVPVIPVHFLDRNSDFYYLLGLIDWRVRLLRLPAEVFNKRSRRTRIALGNPIMPSDQSAHASLSDYTAYLRHQVYGL